MTAKHRRSATKGFEPDEYDQNLDCPVPYIACVCRGVQIPRKLTDENVGYKMRCTNDRCLLANKFFLHKKCSDKLEENLIKILGNEGSARGWTDAQLRSNLWEKKGQSLVGRILRCRCGMGVMSVDVDFYKKQLDEERKQKTFADPKIVQAKKAARKSKLPAVNYNNVRPVPVELLQNNFIPTKSSDHSPQYLTSRSSIERDSPSSTITPSPTPPSSNEQQQSRLFASSGSEKQLDENRKKKSSLSSFGNPSPAIRQSKKLSRKYKIPSSFDKCNGVRTPIHNKMDLLQQQQNNNNDDFVVQNGTSENSTIPSLSSNQYLLSNRSAEQQHNEISLNNKIKNKTTTKTIITSSSLLSQQNQQQQINGAAPFQQQNNNNIDLEQQQQLLENNGNNNNDNIQPRKFYSLFDPDSRGFYLGELILGEFHLPRLLQPSI